MNCKKLQALAICAGVLTPALLAQIPNASLLQIEVENQRRYHFDVDASQFAKISTDLNYLKYSGGTPDTASAFQSYVAIGDIVSVNGAPVKGTAFERVMNLVASPTATPGLGQAIADVARSGTVEWNLDLLNLDGTSLGRILVQGMSGGPGAPGAPSLVSRASFMVVGGTGVFLGVRGGYFQNTPDASAPELVTSVAEDPAYRRIFGGGKTHITLYLICQSPPQVVMTANGPAVAHSKDFTLVSSTNPASAGEVLSLFATGLGPTRPSVDPGKTFPTQPLAAVAAPVSVTVNGVPAVVQAAVGYPGATDGYQVNFQVPSGVGAGPASIQVSAAWITGPEVRIQVQ
jgi:hypothetical protein